MVTGAALFAPASRPRRASWGEMTLRLTVELVCDARRSPGCHGADAAPPGEALPTVVSEGMAEAESAGWGKEEARRNIISDDVCPACRASVQPSPHRRSTGP
jgi:hypothetical protein